MIGAVIVLVVALNPVAVAAVLRGRVDRTVLAVALGVAAVVAVALAVLSEPILDLLSVTAPTFRVAAGAVLGLASAWWLIYGPQFLPSEAGLLGDADPDDRWSALAVPLLVPVILTPQFVAASISVGADDGVLTALIGAAVAVLLAGAAAVLYRGSPGLWSVAVRLVALAGAAAALGLIADGAKTV